MVAWVTLSPTASALITSQTMQLLWASLARYGRPLAPRSGFWPAFTSDAPYVLELVPPAAGASVDFSSDHNCALWKSIVQRASGLPPNAPY
jgi:carboxylesterase type B